MFGVKDFLVAGDSSRAYGPDVPSLAYGEYRRFISREAVPFQEEVAKSSAPWRQWMTDVNDLRTVFEMRAGRNTGEGIPFQKLPGGRVLVTRLVCSREVAEKIAAGCDARLPVPATQEELDALAKLVPASFLAHTGFKEGDDLSGMTLIPPGPDGAGFIATAKEGTKAVGGASLTILSSNEKGMLRYVPSRALLMLERQGWKDGQPQRRRVKYPE